MTHSAVRFVAAIAFVVTSMVLSPSSSRADETGDLRIQFKYGGKAPQPGPVKVTADAAFCGKHEIKDVSLLVNPDNQGLKNVVVYVYTGRGGSKLAATDAPAEKKELVNKECQFEPHILVTKIGDTLEVSNPDAIGHNANIQFFKNKAQNPSIPAGQSVSIALDKAEPAPIPVDCNIHPWMKAFVLVLDHPFAGVSDETGEMIIKGLPVGEKLVFRAYHEKARIKEVEIEGKTKKWKRSRFEVEIKSGMNDLGTITINQNQFKK